MFEARQKVAILYVSVSVSSRIINYPISIFLVYCFNSPVAPENCTYCSFMNPNIFDFERGIFAVKVEYNTKFSLITDLGHRHQFFSSLRYLHDRNSQHDSFSR